MNQRDAWCAKCDGVRIADESGCIACRALEPRPMSHAEISDLVHRAHLAGLKPRQGGPTKGRDRSDYAARWAHDNRETCSEAGRHFGRSAHSVLRAWHRLFPGERPWQWRRR